MQSPSSLIFLVLLGVWAAYFVQYWVRRRDHVATARSVEQFSEAMRVLERRDPLPRTDLSVPSPRSYAVHPARASRPQVLVKRAVATEPGPIGVTERIDDVPDAVAPVAATARPVRRPTHAPAAPRRVRPSRRVRGLLLLGALVELLVIVPLVALSVLPLWALAPAALAVVSTFLFVRSGVRAERRATVRVQARRQSDLARRRASAPSEPSSTATAAGRPARPAASAGEAEAPVEATDVEVATVAEPEHAVVEPLPAEVAVAVAPADDVMVPIVDEDDIPLTWDPVPVPRPTYTMKAKAQRAEVAPAAVTPDPAPVVRESERDESQYDERRVAGA
ncbi:MAG TPA: hypothetical protein VES93_15475 [Ornithinibacter sp.]|nr:hypothetical protein [Ornithinibacter sp.]